MDIERLHKNHLQRTGRDGGNTFYQLNEVIQTISITGPKIVNIVIPRIVELWFMMSMIKDICEHYKLPLLKVKSNALKIGETLVKVFSMNEDLFGLAEENTYRVS